MRERRLKSKGDLATEKTIKRRETARNNDKTLKRERGEENTKEKIDKRKVKRERNLRRRNKYRINYARGRGERRVIG